MMYVEQWARSQPVRQHWKGFRTAISCASPSASPPLASAANSCLTHLLLLRSAEKIHLALMIEKPMLRVLLKELIVRCVRSVLPPSG
jgi:hypothetical protein